MGTSGPTPAPEQNRDITGSLLMCCGTADPLVPLEQVMAWLEQMTDAGVDCIKLSKLGLGEARHDAKYYESKKRSAQEDDFAKHVCCSRSFLIQKLTNDLFLYHLANEFYHFHDGFDCRFRLFNVDLVTAFLSKELLAVTR